MSPLDVGVVAPRHLGHGLEGLRDRLAAETDALERVEVRDVGDQAPDTAGPTDHLGDVGLLDLGLAILLEQACGPRPVLFDLPRQSLFQLHRCSSSIRLKAAGGHAGETQPSPCRIHRSRPDVNVDDLRSTS